MTRSGIHTSLGEEGTEALVRVGSFALFTEESIGLEGANVSAGWWEEPSVSLKVHVSTRHTWMPCSKQYSYAFLLASNPLMFYPATLFVPDPRCSRLTSQQELAI